MRNPQVKNYRVLNVPVADWNQARAPGTAYLNSNDDKEQVDETTVRGLHPALASDRVWNEIKRELGLS